MSGDLKITLPTNLTDVGISLAERTVRFYSMIFQNIPMMGGNPVLRVLLSKMEPHLVKELESASQEQLEKMYQAMLCGLGQVYAPGATALVIDLRKSHVLIEEVEGAVGPRALLDESDAPALVDAVDALGQSYMRAALPSTPPPAVELDPDVQVVPMIAQEPLAPPPPPPPDVAVPDDDDPIVGVELEPGIVVRMRQSEARMLREAGA